MDEPRCPICTRPLIAFQPSSIFLHADLLIFRCPECLEETPFCGETIETPKHFMLTASGELKGLPPDAPRFRG